MWSDYDMLRNLHHIYSPCPSLVMGDSRRILRVVFHLRVFLRPDILIFLSVMFSCPGWQGWAWGRAGMKGSPAFPEACSECAGVKGVIMSCVWSTSVEIALENYQTVFGFGSQEPAKTTGPFFSYCHCRRPFQQFWSSTIQQKMQSRRWDHIGFWRKLKCLSIPELESHSRKLLFSNPHVRNWESARFLSVWHIHHHEPTLYLEFSAQDGFFSKLELNMFSGSQNRRMILDISLKTFEMVKTTPIP